MSTTKTGYVPTTFRDAGTEKEYEGGKTHPFTEGEYINYEAAGLIGEKPKPADKPAPSGAAA